jgi:hypothetical protein
VYGQPTARREPFVQAKSTSTSNSEATATRRLFVQSLRAFAVACTCSSVQVLPLPRMQPRCAARPFQAKALSKGLERTALPLLVPLSHRFPAIDERSIRRSMRLVPTVRELVHTEAMRSHEQIERSNSHINRLHHCHNPRSDRRRLGNSGRGRFSGFMCNM